MRKIVSTLCFTILLILGQIVFGQEKGVGNRTVTELPAKEKRWALIIGADVYQKDISPLYGTVNDARALRHVLIKHAGFTDERIILMTTDASDADLIPTRGNIIDQLDRLQRVVPADGLILFSFSGHGVSIGSDAFIVPSDGRIYQDTDLMRERAIDVLRIKRAIQATKVKQVIMFLDACRNDPVRAKGDADNNLTTAYTKGFSFETKNQNIEAYATLYATSLGDRAYEFLDKKTGKYRGYFSYAIEEGLKGSAANDKGEVTLAGLIRYIEDTVKERVFINENRKQIPYPTTEGFRNSDLVIAITERTTPVITNPKSGEAAFWSAIENSNDTEDFENYLRRSKRGEFTGIYKTTAELKLLRLKKAKAPVVWAGLRVTARKLLKYDYVESFSENLAAVGIPAVSESGVYIFGEAVELNRMKYGFVDRAGKEIIPLKYDDADSFSEGLAKVRIGNYKTGKQGFVDKTGKEVIPVKYDSAESFSEGLASVAIGYAKPDTAVLQGWSFVGKYGFISKTGKEIIPLKYDYAGSFSEGLARVQIGDYLTGKMGFIDETGKEVIPLKYDYVESFSEGLAKVRTGDYLTGKYGFIDKTGKEVMPVKYDSAGSFSEGLVSMGIGNYELSGPFMFFTGKWGFIDKTGKEIIPAKYDQVGSFSEGLVQVQVKDIKSFKSGFVDKTGKEVTPVKYDDVESFSEGLAQVRVGDYSTGKWGIIDKTGKEVVPIKYDKIWCSAFEDKGFIGVELNGKKGFVDIYGNEYFDF